MELRKQHLLNSFSGFIVMPNAIAKRLDDVIRRHTQVSRSFFNHFQYSIQYPDHGSKWFVLTLIESTEAIEMPE